MNGIERIRKQFENKKSARLMTHIVGGYPDIDTCEKILISMSSYADIIEIQLPFSDPTADGPVIVEANYHCLGNGVKTTDVLDLAERVRKKTNIPLLIMSYLNPIFSYGIEKFVDKIISIDLDGVIIPDCPPDTDDTGLVDLCNKNALAFVPLIAPNTNAERMKIITDRSLSPLVYAVLRSGVTGRKTEIGEDAVGHLELIKKITGRYVAAGFGIREKSQIELIMNHADCSIIGSAVISLIGNSTKDGKNSVMEVEKFLKDLTD